MTKAEHAASTIRHRRRWIAPAAVMVIAAAGFGIGLVVTNGDDRADGSSATQIANVEQACQNWMSSSTSVPVSGDWCRNMGSWMSRQLTDGHMGASMMWGDRSRMLETCRQWANTEPASTTNDRSCDDMVSWMTDHMGAEWDNWTMRGSMMGSGEAIDSMHWNNGMHNGGGSGWWLFVVVMMLAFAAGAAWLIATLVRHNSNPPHPPGSTAERLDPGDILHERLARGELDIDEYHQRIDALRAKRPG